MNKIAIFASGGGSNAENIIKFFYNSKKVKIALIACNCPNAKVLKKASKYDVETFLFNKKDLLANRVLEKLNEKKITFIILAGFLLKIPIKIINRFPNKIINIHPSLLPLYGGRGMYGMHVHNAVAEAKDLESGITIHYVNAIYDNGAIIFQAKCSLYKNILPKDIQKKVHKLELKFFPRIINNLLDG
ncbi:MAG: phosphoribosylglycinamide formyltransferase [Flavobacteriales bacterium]|jgi:phosphoribosylglycinamide formyltransferase-1|nr:phosphoribosylglycinamide formyltransferase [Flavobacteriales bacterium]|tara:strand:- start:604 stop:1167 length:564 start_codon:yes stop_codon:yes gene_type:complete